MINPNWKTTEQLEHELAELKEKYELLEVDYNELYEENRELYHDCIDYKNLCCGVIGSVFIIAFFVILLYLKF